MLHPAVNLLIGRVMQRRVIREEDVEAAWRVGLGHVDPWLVPPLLPLLDLGNSRDQHSLRFLQRRSAQGRWLELRLGVLAERRRGLVRPPPRLLTGQVNAYPHGCSRGVPVQS